MVKPIEACPYEIRAIIALKKAQVGLVQANGLGAVAEIIGVDPPLSVIRARENFEAAMEELAEIAFHINSN